MKYTLKGKTMKSPFTGGEIELRHEKKELIFRKERFVYVHHFYECKDTKECFTNTELDWLNLAQVHNQYRVKYGIPFPDQIREIRKLYDLSASKMSEILGFGDNQYRLYENGDMPSEANGKLLSMILQPESFAFSVENAKHQFEEKDFAKIMAKLDKAKNKKHFDIYQEMIYATYSRSEVNGYSLQSVPKLKNILLYFISQLGGVFNTKMNKLLFYTDFLSYKKYGQAMTGLAYKAIQFGPVPLRWDRVYSLIDDIDQEIIEFPLAYSGTKLCSKIDFDATIFSAEDLSVLEAVCDRFREISASEISKMSHEEDAWKNHIGSSSFIDFSLAFSLKAL